MLYELIPLAILVFKKDVLCVKNAIPKEYSVQTNDRSVYWELPYIRPFKLPPTLAGKHIVKYTFVLILNVKQTIGTLLHEVLCVLF